ncbi:hypothetical protein [Rubneribacter sp.]|nr:hypothetical protein [Candidatus Rubneribacter avistercoris]
MPYRSLLCIVARGAGAEAPADPYAIERRNLPNRTHGIRYASSPRHPSRIRTYSPSPFVRPASRPKAPGRPRLPSSGEALKRVAAAVAAMALVAVLGALGGGAFAQAVINADAEGAQAADGGQSASAFASDAPSTWTQGQTPALYQADPAWAGRPYGSGTMKTAGGAPLCLAMARARLTGDASADPVAVASFAQSGGYAEDPERLLDEGAAKLGLSVTDVEPDEAALRREIVAGRPVIATLADSAFGSETAYVVLGDIDEHGMLVVSDPRSPERSERHWDFEDVLPHASALRSYAVAG